MKTLRIGHGNGHNESSMVLWARRSEYDSMGLNEAQKRQGDLEGIVKRRVVRAYSNDPRGMNTAVLIDRNLPEIGRVTRQVSEPLAFDAAHTRVMVGAMYKHPLAKKLGFEGVAHFEVHPTPAPKQLNGNDPNAPAVREYREAMASMRLWMQAARNDNLLLVMTGDLQVRASHTKPWGPRKMLCEPLNLSYKTSGIDWILYDEKLVLARRMQYKALFDHTGFIATFTGRGVQD